MFKINRDLLLLTNIICDNAKKRKEQLPALTKKVRRTASYAHTPLAAEGSPDATPSTPTYAPMKTGNWEFGVPLRVVQGFSLKGGITITTFAHSTLVRDLISARKNRV